MALFPALVLGTKFFGRPDIPVPFDVIIQAYNAYNELLQRHDAFHIPTRNSARLRIL